MAKSDEVACFERVYLVHLCASDKEVYDHAKIFKRAIKFNFVFVCGCMCVYVSAIFTTCYDFARTFFFFFYFSFLLLRRRRPDKRPIESHAMKHSCLPTHFCEKRKREKRKASI